MMPRTLGELQPLLAQFSGTGMVVSCYAAIEAEEGFRPRWQGPFEAKSDLLWKAVGEDGRARSELEENLAAVRRALESPDTHAIAMRTRTSR